MLFSCSNTYVKIEDPELNYHRLNQWSCLQMTVRC